MIENYKEFRRNILKLDKPRIHRVRNSLGIYDSYKWIRKNKWLDIGRSLTEHEFYIIIRLVNNLLADELLKGHDIRLPHRLGTIELRKFDARILMQEGVLRTNLPVDWDRTLRLWAEDRQSYDLKLLVRLEEKELFKVTYNKKNAIYNNKAFYEFEVNRDLKRRLKQRIKDKAVDAFKL